MATPQQCEGPPLTQSLLRAELDAFAKETLHREFEDLKNSLIKEVVDHLSARGVELTLAQQPRASTRGRPPSPSLGQTLHEEGSPAAHQPLMLSGKGDELYQEIEDVQSDGPEETWQSARYQCLSAFVKGTTFDFLAGAFVMLSVVWLTFQTDYVARRWLTHAPDLFVYVDLFFLVGFVTELFLRIFVFGVKEFFCGPQKYGGWFDAALVVIQALDVFQEMFDLAKNQTQWVPLLRILRLFRVFRLVRVFRVFPALRLLIVSVVQSVQPLIWVFRGRRSDTTTIKRATRGEEVHDVFPSWIWTCPERDNGGNRKKSDATTKRTPPSS
ncbi:unnamed protein product [Prorocentrum cordatum]|uniref:Ion transport domain-containing protein n=1 Tax=Prorocentrum cordatum TaxID=2364126 RepID=A0ABN9X3A6_9DINO|nr:unnamed protein product [Polarella glacialis]